MLATVLVSVSFTAAGVIAVDECAHRISLGEPQRVVAWGNGAVIREPAEVIQLGTDNLPFVNRLKRDGTKPSLIF